MKKNIGYILKFSFVFFLIYGCKKQEVTIPDSLSQFNTKSVTESYFITNTATTVYKIPIGVTTVSDKDRTINFSITSPTGATQGAQYTVTGNSLVIKAGQVTDTIMVKGIFAGFPGARRDTLKFELTGGDTKVATYAKNFNLVLQKFCNVTFGSFTGAYKATDFDDVGAVASSIVDYPVTFTPQADNKTIRVNNLWEVPVNVNVELDYSNPANFTTTVPDQNFFVHSTYGQVKIRAWGKGTFSSCDNTFEIRYEPYVPGLGSFGLYVSRIKK